MMEKQKETIIKVDGLPIVANFNWSVGYLMEKFIKSLADKKLLASKCPQCSHTYAPPRTRCAKCCGKIAENDLTELTGKGELISHSTAHVKLDGRGLFKKLPECEVIGAIKLDGADSTFFAPVQGIEKAALKKGLKLKIKFRDKTKGEISDIECFVPDR